MKVIAAPNAFKGCMDAVASSRAMKEGILRVNRDFSVDRIPVADGGDGLTEVMAQALSGRIEKARVRGPRMEMVTAPYCISGAVGVVEMARASGLALLDRESRNPELTTTYGTGELIGRALDKGADRIIIGLGGSATCDGGIGLASALGYRFYDGAGRQLEPVGGSLASIRRVDSSRVDPRIPGVRFEAVCDVTNPFTGPEGASYVYSPQKGATPEQVRRLDEGLKNLAAVVRDQLSIDIENMPGAGAAGGLGGGIHAFLGAKLKNGINLVLELVDFKNRIKDADLVLTAEGQIDFQTKFDKAPAGVARAAREAGIPCVAICGGVGERIEELHEIGIDAVFSLCRGPQSLEAAMKNGYEQLTQVTEQVIRTVLAAKGITGSGSGRRFP